MGTSCRKLQNTRNQEVGTFKWEIYQIVYLYGTFGQTPLKGENKKNEVTVYGTIANSASILKLV